MAETADTVAAPASGLKTDIFDFDLPRELIADRPAIPRDSARLLKVGDELADLHVADLPGLLRPGDIMVVNDTRVIPARLTGKRGHAKIEITLHRHLGGNAWRAFARPAKRLAPGDVVDFAPGFNAAVTEKFDGGEIALAFPDGLDLGAALQAHGTMPLPPYIPRDRGADTRDSADYQTVYAAEDGAVAAPTAGLHFTPELLKAIEAMGVRVVQVTLHVGAGTFLPVKSEFVYDHRMHAEWGRIDAETADAVNAARDAGGRVIAIGTTSLRLLESAADTSGRLAPFAAETDIFITPGYRFRVVDLLLTNFHLPRSTLFMLVAAFAGLERMRAAYEHARETGYRFYSYGDATLLHRNDGR